MDIILLESNLSHTNFLTFLNTLHKPFPNSSQMPVSNLFKTCFKLFIAPFTSPWKQLVFANLVEALFALNWNVDNTCFPTSCEHNNMEFPVLQMHVGPVWAGEVILLALLVWKRKTGWIIDWRHSVDGRTHFGWDWILETFLYSFTGVMEAHTNWLPGMLDTPGTHHRVSVSLKFMFSWIKSCWVFFSICQRGFVLEP